MKATMPAGVQVRTGIAGSWCVLHKNGSLEPGSNGAYIDAVRQGEFNTRAEVVRSGRVVHREHFRNDQAPESLVDMAKRFLS